MRLEVTCICMEINDDFYCLDIKKFFLFIPLWSNFYKTARINSPEYDHVCYGLLLALTLLTWEIIFGTICVSDVSIGFCMFRTSAV